jgi:hypothetical protein
LQEINISKGGGKFRRIVVPPRKERRRLQRLVPRIAALERSLAIARQVSHVAHGFIVNRNPVTCARMHAGPDYLFTVTMDLADWFDSILDYYVARALREAGVTDRAEQLQLTHTVTYKGRVPQGFPTSPSVANLCAVQFDQQLLGDLQPGTVYTRYADDLTFSCRDWMSVEVAQDAATNAAAHWGWQVAHHKTHVYHRYRGRRAVVVGISVGADSLQPTRKTRRRLRAALHHGDSHRNEARGLAEWAACKLPRALRGLRMLRLDATVPVPVSLGYGPVQPLPEVTDIVPGTEDRLTGVTSISRPFRRLKLD